MSGSGVKSKLVEPEFNDAMYCPNRECPHRQGTGEPAEYRAGVTHCRECGTALVDREPTHDGNEIPSEPFVPVFEIPNAGLVPLVESLLQETDIRFFIKGIGAGLDFVTGPVKVYVEESHADEARELLEEVRVGDESPPEPED